ncbi:type VII secretion integral membrane protein EccD [Actinomadura sp. 21ATH]|uniref:type VII secretion integral membrane protein EccD n=1 Tax=Actinomadura sp. 21ATH TaxID=1735444 RepID=UPI0035C24821
MNGTAPALNGHAPTSPHAYDAQAYNAQGHGTQGYGTQGYGTQGHGGHAHGGHAHGGHAPESARAYDAQAGSGQAESGEAAADGYCRVTVAGPRRRADLVLPGGVPVAVLLPRLMEICVPDRDGADPAAWRLARLDGRPVAAAESLEAAGVADGEVLMLHPRSVRVRPAEVEDVRGAVEDHVDGSVPLWGPRTTLAFALVMAAAGPLAAAAAAGWATAWDLPAGTAAGRAACALAAALAAVAAAWTCGDRPVLGRIMAGAGCLWGGLAAALAGTALAGAAPVPAALGALAATGALAAAGLAWARLPAALPFVSGTAVLVGAAGVLSTGALIGAPAQGVRVTAVLLVLAVGALPRAAMTLGGLAGADQRAREHGRIPAGQVDERLRTTEDLLIGALAGLGTGAVLTLLVLAAGGPRDQVLAAVAAAALVLRSRMFDRVAHVLSVRVPGAAGLGAVAVAAAAEQDRLAGWTPALALAAAVIVCGLSAVPLPPVPRARLRRVLDWTETLAIVAMAVAAAASMGLFDRVRDLSF